MYISRITFSNSGGKNDDINMSLTRIIKWDLTNKATCTANKATEVDQQTFRNVNTRVSTLYPQATKSFW